MERPHRLRAPLLFDQKRHVEVAVKRPEYVDPRIPQRLLAFAVNVRRSPPHALADRRYQAPCFFAELGGRVAVEQDMLNDRHDIAVLAAFDRELNAAFVRRKLSSICRCSGRIAARLSATSTRTARSP